MDILDILTHNPGGVDLRKHIQPLISASAQPKNSLKLELNDVTEKTSGRKQMGCLAFDIYELCDVSRIEKDLLGD